MWMRKANAELDGSAPSPPFPATFSPSALNIYAVMAAAAPPKSAAPAAPPAVAEPEPEPVAVPSTDARAAPAAGAPSGPSALRKLRCAWSRFAATVLSRLTPRAPGTSGTRRKAT